jgi:hypothetical protein
MNGGVILTEKATGDVFYLSREGKELLEPTMNIEVKIKEEFPGVTINDAIEEAKRFAIGAIKNKVMQRTRGITCVIIVRNLDIKYKIKYGFKGAETLTKELHFKAGDRIVKKGDFGQEFFWVKEGTVEIDKVLYTEGNVFGRSAFTDGIRKKDAYAKTDAVIIAINKDHPDLLNKIPVIFEKFAQEVDMIKRIRPKAEIEEIRIDS